MISKIFTVKEMNTKKKLGRFSTKSFILQIAEPYGLTEQETERIIYSDTVHVIAGLFITTEVKGEKK